jgi:hypothetical protein
MPLILGLLGFYSQQVFACTGALLAGCNYCKDDPARCGLPTYADIARAADNATAACKKSPESCGITQQTITVTVTVPDLEGGKKSCLDNLSACTASGSPSGDVQLNTAKSNGVTEGKNTCINNPSSCGISSQDPNAITTAKNEGRAECINNPTLCGITSQDPNAITNATNAGILTGKNMCISNPSNCGLTIQDPNALTSILPVYDLKNQSLVLPKYRVRNDNGSFDDATGKDGATLQYTGEWVFDNKNNYYLQLILKKLPAISDEFIVPQSGLINLKKLGEGHIYYTSSVDTSATTATVTIVAKSDKSLTTPILFDSYCESVTTKKEGEATISVIEATPNRSSLSSSVAFITDAQIFPASKLALISVSPPFTTCSFSITKGTLTNRQISITFPK